MQGNHPGAVPTSTLYLALGAKPAKVLSMFLRQGVGLTLMGVTLGVFAALGTTRLISSMIT